MDKFKVGIGAFTLVIVGGAILAVVGSEKASDKLATLPNDQARIQCVQHGGISMHFHPRLSILIDDEPVSIPTDVGIDPACMKAIHTHEESGTIHLEYPTLYDFILADFFANWGQTFSSQEIMGHRVDDTHVLTMTVNGQPSTDFEQLILRDGQVIEIRYETKTS